MGGRRKLVILLAMGRGWRRGNGGAGFPGTKVVRHAGGVLLVRFRATGAGEAGGRQCEVSSRPNAEGRKQRNGEASNRSHVQVE